MFVLYDLVFIIFAIAYLPLFLLRKKLHQGFAQRLGFLPRALRLDRPIWVHAVSVGEAKVAGILVKQLRQAYPAKRFVFSTITTTGNKIVRSFQQEGDFVFYLPFDLSFIIRRVISRLKPSVCIIVETEIWPNLINQLDQMNVPTILVNARISDRSFLGYRMIKPLLKSTLNRVRFFCIQSQKDARRLSTLGVYPDKLKVTGNMKFDFFQDCPECTNDKLKLGLRHQERLFVAGSTHPGEEEVILSAYKKLLAEFPDLRLLLAPRHPERSSEVESIIGEFGFTPIRISKLDLSAKRYPLNAIFILDTIGELFSFYAIADIVFVGGSLIKKGGHNILEPAYFSKPILFGPYMFNFLEMSDLFLAEQAARMVPRGEELPNQIRFLLSHSDELKAIGQRARQLVLNNQGATKRIVQLIKTAVQI